MTFQDWSQIDLLVELQTKLICTDIISEANVTDQIYKNVFGWCAKPDIVYFVKQNMAVLVEVQTNKSQSTWTYSD